MSNFDKWFAPRAARINELTKKLEPYLKEYIEEDGKGNWKLNIDKIKADSNKMDFVAATTPIMFRKEDIKKED